MAEHNNQTEENNFETKLRELKTKALTSTKQL